MPETTPLQIDVVADVVCPWCFVGRRHLAAAMARLPDIDFRLVHRPFQLDARIPREGVERHAYINAKLGGADRVREAHRHLETIGQDLGIPFDFAAIRVAPNTLDAHRLIRWAGEAEVQDAMVERLFQLYFVEGADIGDPDVLADAAAAVGMVRDEVRGFLDTEADLDAVRTEIAHAQRVGITGVPCLVIEAKYAVMGAQPADMLVNAFRDIAEEKRFGAKS